MAGIGRHCGKNAVLRKKSVGVDSCPKHPVAPVSEPMASSTTQSMVRLVSILSALANDLLWFLLLGTRSKAALETENIYLRKQLALYLERRTKPDGRQCYTVVYRSAFSAVHLAERFGQRQA